MCGKFLASLIHGWDSLKEGLVMMAAHVVGAPLEEEGSTTAAGGRGWGRTPGPGNRLGKQWGSWRVVPRCRLRGMARGTESQGCYLCRSS